MRVRIFLGILLAAALPLLNGCTALNDRTEQAWLTLHAVDSVQTYRIAQDPLCFHEANAVTQVVIGETPSRGQVIAWSLGSAAIHLGVTELLLRNEHPKLAKAWQYISIASTGYSVGNNYAIGIRIGSPNKPKERCLNETELKLADPFVQH